MTSASLAVQAALHAALTAAPGLAGVAVFDWVAPDAAAPYLTIGADSVADWSHKTGTGHEHRVQINVWDDRPGTARLKALAAAAEAAVRGVTGTVDGHRVAGVIFVHAVFLKGTDGWSQASLDFRIRTEQL
jgi:hypothetical protein